MPGPPPKPPGQRQRRNARAVGERKGIGLVPAPGGQVVVPPPPPGLLKDTREAWAQFWRSPLAPLVVDADHPALERLFTLADERTRALRAYRKRRIVYGSQGQPVLNPLFAAMSKLDAEVRSLEDRFGMSPMARLRIGAQLGDAARSLEDLNAGLEADDDHHDEPTSDPRVRVVDATSAAAPTDAGT